jgi:riboflavin synthase
MKVNDRFGGHMVQGHIDGVAEIIEIIAEGDSKRVTLTCSEHLLKMIPEKGYITIDGMSLTIVANNHKNFSVAFIPLTLSLTTAGNYTIGQHVNLEIDITIKTIMHLLNWEENDVD